MGPVLPSLTILLTERVTHVLFNGQNAKIERPLLPARRSDWQWSSESRFLVTSFCKYNFVNEENTFYRVTGIFFFFFYKQRKFYYEKRTILLKLYIFHLFGILWTITRFKFRSFQRKLRGTFISRASTAFHRISSYRVPWLGFSLTSTPTRCVPRRKFAFPFLFLIFSRQSSNRTDV